MNREKLIREALQEAGAQAITYSPPWYQFQIQGKTRTWELEVKWQNISGLPKFHLAAGHCTQHRPHVAWDRNICYSDGEGIFFNHEQPKEVIHSALESVVEVLENGETGNLGPFWDEQEGYFNLVGPEAIRGVAECYFQLDETPCKLETFKSANRKRPVKFLKDKSDDWGLNPSLYLKEQLEQAKRPKKRKQKGIAPQCHSPAAFYIPLDKPAVPPLPGQEWEVEQVMELVEPFIPKLPELETHLKKNNQLYVFSVPRSVGGSGAFAVEISPRRKTGPKVFYLEVDRRHDSYLKERGGVRSDYRLSDENVAVIGCGAVGGYIATTLANCGFRNIELVDCDTFKAENLYRHVLPYKYLGGNKVSGLKALLENSFPSMNIKESILDAEAWCTKNNLDQNQIIFLATGNPVLERYINQAFCAERRGDHVLISTWLEPLGLGGHVVLKASDSKGCLNCLYVEGNDLRYHPIPSFIEPGQKVSKNLTGCGGAFTPFSSLDAQQTALLAVRAMENYYSAPAGSIYDFWMGDKSAAEENNVRTSEVFESSFCDKDLWWQQKLSHGCPVCMGC